MKNYKLVYKSKILFAYECVSVTQSYTKCIELVQKDVKYGTHYKGIQLLCFEKETNSDGFNNAVGLRRNDLLRLPFMILHFKLYQLFGKGDK